MEHAGKPRLVVEPNPYEERCRLELRELPGLHLDCVRIVQSGRQALHAHTVAADGLDESLKIRGGRDDGKRATAPRRDGGEQDEGERTAQSTAS